jgi:hypothetical protein
MLHKRDLCLWEEGIKERETSRQARETTYQREEGVFLEKSFSIPKRV